MVGLVVVSHSRALARAAVALAQEMLHGRRVPIVVAAGLDDGTFGTDAGQIVDAVTEADDGEGVVVLMDLGSAVLSAELALDLLDDDARARVALCSAPLVEGLIVAAVAAAGGASRDEVVAEANAALAGKQSHLGVDVPDQVPTAPTSGSGPTLQGDFVVALPHGLHARPAARVVQEVRTLDAHVELRNAATGSAWVPADSLSRVATLGALQDHRVDVRASGRQAREALDRVLALAARDFDEVPASSAPSRTSPRRGPIAASPGIGIAPAWLTEAVPIDAAATYTPDGDPAVEWRRLREAIAQVRRNVQRDRTKVAREIGEADAAIFDAHLLLLDDADLLGTVRAAIQGRTGAAAAWTEAVDDVVTRMAALPDPYLQARAVDVRSIGDQVLRALVGKADVSEPSGVLVAEDLTPAAAARLDPARVAAVLLSEGAPTAHSTILIRSRGIPAIVGAGSAILEIAGGTLVAVDGTRGEFVVAPASRVVNDFRARAAERHRQAEEAAAAAGVPARTRDDVHILVGANVGSVDEAATAVRLGADLAGLVRTEFLFHDRAYPPDVEEQEAAYRGVAAAFAGRRVILRTLDVGGDKPLAYISIAAEANPFLGVRGLRLSLAEPKLLADQLRGIVRTAHDWPISVMFPMVTTLDELMSARRLLDEAGRDEGGLPSDLQLGIMVETPATALKAAAFAPHVDFFSIGTNDLTQYALAAERGNAAVASVGDAYDPGLLRLIEATCAGAGDSIPVAVCGELAADAAAVPLLIGLGVHELSVVPHAIPSIKQAIREVDSGEARELAQAALRADSADDVRALLAASSTNRR